MTDINTTIENAIDKEEFYREYFPDAVFDFEGRVKVTCPFHDDKTPSLSLSIDKGNKCFGCGKKFSGPIGFYQLWMSRDNKRCSFTNAAKKLYSRYIRPVIDNRRVDKWHQALLTNMKARQVLESRAINEFGIRKFLLGWDEDEERFTLPITNEQGWVTDIRKIKTKEYISANAKRKIIKNLPYDWETAKQKKERGEITHGQGGRVFPVTNCDKAVIFLCEGEFDAIVLIMNGFNAVTTGGCQVSKKHYKLFKNKQVVLCLDNDEAGRSAAQILLRELHNIAKRVTDVVIPIEGGDVTDFFTSGRTKEDFQKLVDNATVRDTVEPTKPELPASGSEVVSLHSIEDMHNPFNYGKRAVLNARLVAEKDTRFSIATQYELRCPTDRGKVCTHCPMLEQGGEHYGRLDPTSPMFLSMLGVSDKVIRNEIVNDFGAPVNCTSLKMEATEVLSVRMGKVAPQIKRKETRRDKNQQEVLTLCGELELNSDYSLEGAITKDPNTQSTIFVVDKATPLDTAFGSSYAPEKERAEQLIEKFSPEEDTVESILERHSELNEILAKNVTNIYGREELHTAINLTFHSPLHLKWEPNGKVINSYMETAIIGDTNTGKNAVLDSLCEYYKAGLVVDSASTTRAGLLGAFDEKGYFGWGAYVQQHGKLLGLNEGSNLKEVMETMRCIREGKADYFKAAGSMQTVCKTRCIILANDPHGHLSSHPYPILSLPALFPHEADISRFTYACFLRGEDTPLDIVNKAKPPRIKTEITQQDFQDVLSFAWSIPHEKIKFTKDAIQEIYAQATRMSKKYSATIPLIQSSIARNNIAAITAALANQLFNYDVKLGAVRVSKAFVKAAVHLMESHYDSPACQYDVYSEQERSRSVITEEKAIVAIFDKERTRLGGNLINCLRNILSSKSVDYDYLSDNFMSLESSSAVRLTLKILTINRCVTRDGKLAYKTLAFTKLIKKLLAAEEEGVKNAKTAS